MVSVIPAKAGIQTIIQSPRSGTTPKTRLCPLRGAYDKLDSGLMKQLAIRLGCQKTTTKSLVIRRNDGLFDFVCCLHFCVKLNPKLARGAFVGAALAAIATPSTVAAKAAPTKAMLKLDNRRISQMNYLG